MKILKMNLEDQTTIRATFGFEHNGIEFFQWRILDGRDGLWISPPRTRGFEKTWGTGRFEATVKLPGPLLDELKTLALRAYEDLSGLNNPIM